MAMTKRLAKIKLVLTRPPQRLLKSTCVPPWTKVPRVRRRRVAERIGGRLRPLQPHVGGMLQLEQHVPVGLTTTRSPASQKVPGDWPRRAVESPVRKAGGAFLARVKTTRQSSPITRTGIGSRWHARFTESGGSATASSMRAARCCTTSSVCRTRRQPRSRSSSAASSRRHPAGGSGQPENGRPPPNLSRPPQA